MRETKPTGRRQLLHGAAACVVLAVAGCVDSGSTNDSGSPNQGDSNDDSNDQEPTDTQEPATEEPDTEEPDTTTEASEEDAVKLLSHEFYEENFSWGVEGVIENVTDDTLSYVEVAVRFYDEEGTLIAEGLDNFSDLRPGKAEFEAMSFGDDEAKSRTEDYEIEVEWRY